MNLACTGWRQNSTKYGVFTSNRIQTLKQESRSEASKIASERILETTERFTQGHPMDRFGGISVRREMSSRAFLINAFCFRRDKNDVLGTKIGQLGFSERQ